MNYRDLLVVILIYLLMPQSNLEAQNESISLYNPSFEGTPRPSKAPIGWVDCNFFDETPPDVQPGFFEVTTEPQDGNTYLGLVVRNNDTWEAVSQRLPQKLSAGTCYSFSMFLCRSETYESMLINYSDSGTEVSRDLYKFNTPAVLRIYGGNSYVDKRELLYETNIIENKEWKKYEFRFEPKASYGYIILEAFYKTPLLFPYNGNVLADNASDIVPIPCDEDEIIPEPIVDFTNPKKGKTVQNKSYTVFAKAENVKSKNDIVLTVNRNVVKNFAFDPSSGKISAKVNLLEGRNALKIKATNSSGTAEDLASLTFEPAQIIVSVEPERVPDEPIPNSYEDVSPIPEPRALEGVSRKNMKTGQTIKLSRLYFDRDQTFIKDNSFGALNEIYDFLKFNDDIVIEIGGHTNSNCSTDYCDELSEKRAKAVADYLIEKGITANRVTYKGYGKRNPLVKNSSREERKKNQRVEIKIVSLDG